MTTHSVKAAEAVVVRTRFVRINYFINWGNSDPRKVSGYAFETPGWPQFHACVRFDTRDWGKKAWILDHYESGRALRHVVIKTRGEAPEALAAFLSGKGATKVNNALTKARAP